jgi:hypothetical protein
VYYTNLSLQNDSFADVNNITFIDESKWYIVLSCDTEANRKEAMSSNYEVKAVISDDGETVEIENGKAFQCNWRPSNSEFANLNIAIPLIINRDFNCKKVYIKSDKKIFQGTSNIRLLETSYGKHAVGQQ